MSNWETSRKTAPALRVRDPLADHVADLARFAEHDRGSAREPHPIVVRRHEDVLGDLADEPGARSSVRTDPAPGSHRFDDWDRRTEAVRRRLRRYETEARVTRGRRDNAADRVSLPHDAIHPRLATGSRDV